MCVCSAALQVLALVAGLAARPADAVDRVDRVGLADGPVAGDAADAGGGDGGAPEAKAIAQPAAGAPREPSEALKVKVEEGAAAGAVQEARVVFRGNLLFSDFVYRSFLDLPEDVRATPEEARAVADRLQAFLRRAGFDLAVVTARVEEGRILVEVDEGQLDKIVVRGSGLVETLRFKLELVLPANVFDRLRLEQQLGELAKRYHLNRYSYELVPVRAREVGGLQWEWGGLAPMLGLPSLQPGQRYELHILVASDPWSRGFSPELSLDSVAGLNVGGLYRHSGLLLRGDRLQAMGRIAGNLRAYLDGPGTRLVFSRASTEVRWQTPSLLVGELRPALGLRVDYLSRQRPDLRLENFDVATLGAAVDASWTFASRLTLTGGAGIERRFLFAMKEAIWASPLLERTPSAQTRLYAEILAGAVFDPEVLRTDRRHELSFSARWYLPTPSSGEALWLRGRYQIRMGFGWHELWLSVAGAYLAGNVLFPDEETLGDYLRGVFGSSLYSRAVTGAEIEFRFSVVRDAAKIGVFYDQAVYGAIDRFGGPVTPATAGAGGPSLHFLLGDEFELAGYLAFGWTPKRFDFAPTVVFRQVY